MEDLGDNKVSVVLKGTVEPKIYVPKKFLTKFTENGLKKGLINLGHLLAKSEKK